ncbi:TVP38/TMEM64 family protein [Candidatus Woesearchaeota archaeon]|nr:TVP38/TMEM64 family protein [Candidatus Woesearchaeota archaeon]
MKHKHRYWGYVGLLVVMLIFGYLNYFFDLKQFADPIFVRDFLLSFGVWSYLVYMVMLLATIPLPIPSTPVVLAGGYVFGTIVGTILSLIAGAMGSSIAFLLTRKYGRPMLERLVDKHHIIQFNHIFKKRGTSAAFVSYTIPTFPSDAISLMLGLTKMSFHTFLLLYFFAHIPRYLILNSIGSDLFHGFSATTFVVLILALGLILVALFRERLKKVFFKELHEVEKEVKKLEKEI